VVRVIDALAGAEVERVAAGDGNSIGVNDGIEDRLLERGGPYVGGEGSAVDGDVDAAVGLIATTLTPLAAGAARALGATRRPAARRARVTSPDDFKLSCERDNLPFIGDFLRG